MESNVHIDVAIIDSLSDSSAFVTILDSYILREMMKPVKVVT
jgi:hypothetical protein